MNKPSERAFKEFFENPVWIWLKDELNILRTNVRDNLENAKNQNELWRNQGRAQVLRDIINIPEALYEELYKESE